MKTVLGFRELDYDYLHISLKFFARLKKKPIYLCFIKGFQKDFRKISEGHFLKNSLSFLLQLFCQPSENRKRRK